LQYSYSLIDSGVELDLLPAGQALGLGLVAWSSLAFGMLTGEYGREKLADFAPAGSVPNKAGEQSGGSDGRLKGDNPYGGMLFTEANLRVVDELRAVGRRSVDRWRR
jgi:aryl-alcohol dehydrogenase-like predicted oxidoreductase